MFVHLKHIQGYDINVFCVYKIISFINQWLCTISLSTFYHFFPLIPSSVLPFFLHFSPSPLASFLSYSLLDSLIIPPHQPTHSPPAILKEVKNWSWRCFYFKMNNADGELRTTFKSWVSTWVWIRRLCGCHYFT